MGFVKTVTGKFFHQIKDLPGQLGVDTVLCAAFQEHAAHFFHFFRFFLAHGTAQHVSTTQGESCHHLSNLHHLLLIQDDAVGGFQYRFQHFQLVIRVRIGQRCMAMFTLDKVIHHAGLQRAGSEECHQGDHVFQTVGLELFNQLFHAAGFQLEYRSGFCLLQQGKGFWVVEWNGGDVQRCLTLQSANSIHITNCPVDDGQSAQTQKVKLDQSGFFHIIFIKLHHQSLAFFIRQQGSKISEFGGGDDHATGVLAGVAGDAFQFPRHRPDFITFLIQTFELLFGQVAFLRGLVSLFQCLEFFHFFSGFFQRHADFKRNQFGQPITYGVGFALGACHIPYYGLGGHGAEGDYLGNGITTIGFSHIIYDSITAIHAEVDVEVGHRNPLRVQEAFKQQAVFQRIKIGDIQ